MTPTQARKILRGIVPISASDWCEMMDRKESALSLVEIGAVATLINALLSEPPAVVRARERLLSAAMRTTDSTITWGVLIDAACDYADAVEAAKAKAKRGKR